MRFVHSPPFIYLFNYLYHYGFLEIYLILLKIIPNYFFLFKLFLLGPLGILSVCSHVMLASLHQCRSSFLSTCLLSDITRYTCCISRIPVLQPATYPRSLSFLNLRMGLETKIWALDALTSWDISFRLSQQAEHLIYERVLACVFTRICKYFLLRTPASILAKREFCWFPTRVCYRVDHPASFPCSSGTSRLPPYPSDIYLIVQIHINAAGAELIRMPVWGQTSPAERSLVKFALAPAQTPHFPAGSLLTVCSHPLRGDCFAHL